MAIFIYHQKYFQFVHRKSHELRAVCLSPIEGRGSKTFFPFVVSGNILIHLIRQFMKSKNDVCNCYYQPFKLLLFILLKFRIQTARVFDCLMCSSVALINTCFLQVPCLSRKYIGLSLYVSTWYVIQMFN